MAKQNHDIGAQKRLRNEIVVEDARHLRKILTARKWKLINKRREKAWLQKKTGTYFPFNSPARKIIAVSLIDNAVLRHAA